MRGNWTLTKRATKIIEECNYRKVQELMHATSTHTVSNVQLLFSMVTSNWLLPSLVSGRLRVWSIFGLLCSIL